MLRVFLDDVICPEFLGVNAVYHPFAEMPFNAERGMTANDILREYNLISSIGLKLARAWYRPDWACGDDLHNPFDWETAEMQGLYRWLTVMQKIGVSVALQSGWWCTRDTYMGHDGPNPARDLPRYAEWVSESLHQLITLRGYANITHLSLFTEGVNYQSGLLPEGVSQTQYYGMAIRAIHERLVADGRHHLVRTVGPNSGSTTSASWIETARADFDDCIDVYSWHSYNGDNFDTNPPKEYHGWLNLVQQGTRKLAGSAKPYWFDEYGANRPDESVRSKPDYGCYLAQAVAAFINGGCQTSLLWILLDQKYPFDTTNNDSFYRGVQRWGLVPWRHDDLPDPIWPRPAWYAFDLMSRILGGGAGFRSLRTTCEEDVYIAAIEQPGKRYALLVVNGAHEPRTVSFQLSRPLDTILERWVYDPASFPLPQGTWWLHTDKGRFRITDSWEDVLPPRGVMLYRTMGSETMSDESLNKIQFLKEFGMMLFGDIGIGEELEKVFHLIQTDASSAYSQSNDSWWVEVRDATKYAVENCTAIELDAIIGEGFGYYPYLIGGSKPFLARLYNVLNEALRGE
jgi:hypothetical protein